jgi:hypothetical protein
MAAVVILVAVVPARAQDLPKAEDVFKKAVEASGGREAHKALKSMHVQGALDVAGANGDVDIYQARPNKQLVKVTINGMVVQQRGCDGKAAWEVNVMTGASVKTGKDLEEALEEANFDRDLNDPTTYKTATVVARERFEGAECYKVKVERPSGKPVIKYFDTKTGLQVGTEAKVKSAAGEFDVSIILGDFKTFGKLKLPTKVTQRAAGQEVVITVKAVTFDDVDDKTFEPPAEVKDLLKK